MNIQTQMNAYTALKSTIIDLVTRLDLDEERIASRINNTKNNDQGIVLGMLELLFSIAKWPANNSEKPSQEAVDLVDGIINPVLLSDIQLTKGFHTWFNPTEMEIYEGREPEWDDYREALITLLESLGVENADEAFKFRPGRWARAEKTSVKRAKAELAIAKQTISEVDPLANLV